MIDDIYRQLGRNTEIIAVARGSKEYFKRLRRKRVKVVYQKVKSVESSIKVGFDMAHGDILATTDADGTHETAGIAKAVRIVEAGKADLVLGNRMNGLQKGSMGAYLAFGNSAISAIFSLLYGVRVHDALTGLFVTNKKTYELIRNAKLYKAGSAYFVIEFAKRHVRIDEVDIKYYPRKYGRSQLARFKFLYGLGVGLHLLRNMIANR